MAFLTSARPVNLAVPSYMYKVQFEKCQKLLKLWDMGAYISKDTTDYRAQASSIFSKVKALFNDNNL